MGLSGVGGSSGAIPPSQSSGTSTQQFINDYNNYEKNPTEANYNQVIQDVQNLEKAGKISPSLANKFIKTMAGVSGLESVIANLQEEYDHTTNPQKKDALLMAISFLETNLQELKGHLSNLANQIQQTSS
jgi:predicted patatin/cPLA2 family phospholipase